MYIYAQKINFEKCRLQAGNEKYEKWLTLFLQNFLKIHITMVQLNNLIHRYFYMSEGNKNTKCFVD